ncbi:MAG: DsbA family protein [Gammaproteobacteria bacterium]
MTPIRLQLYSDVLCVWAYVSQARIQELEREFPQEILIEHHWFQVFGHVAAKLEANWRERGGAAGYGAHVREVVAKFGHVPVHPEIWARATPASSMPAHLLLCAAGLLEGALRDRCVPRLADAIRTAFFRDLRDVSDWQVLLDVAQECALPEAELEGLVRDGRAFAMLSGDLDLARDNQVRASPTLLFNEGRQRLTGNVGYRVLVANVRELLQAPAGGQSWC